MSTLVTGEADLVFTALHEAFVRAARLARGDDAHTVQCLSRERRRPHAVGEL